MLSRKGRWNTPGSWLTSAIASFKLSQVTPAMSWPSISIRPPCGSECRPSSFMIGRLAGARGPHQRHLLAGCDLEVELVEQLRAVGVGVADIAEGDGTAGHGQGLHPRPVDDLVRLGHQVDGLGQGADLLEEVEHAVGQ